MSDKEGSGCDPLHFALRVAAASDTLARLHRDVVASDPLTQPGSEGQQQAPHADAGDLLESAAIVRQRQILKLTERLASAAETLAQSHKKAVLKRSEAACGGVRESVAAFPAAVKLTSLMARDARRAADRQARSSAVPQAWEVEVLCPEWVQHRLRRQLIASAVGESGQVHSVSERQTLNLTCPLSGGLIRVPVRGQDCQHMDCFDLESLRQSTPNGWRCPMVGCAASVAPDLLRKDSFVAAVLLHADTSLSAISICPEVASTTTDGSMVERAKTLAQVALSLHAKMEAPRTSKALATKDLSLICASMAVQIDDSDSEAAPQTKRSRRTTSSMGGA